MLLLKWSLFICSTIILLGIAIYDWKTCYIKNKALCLLLIPTMTMAFMENSWTDILLGMCVVSFPMWLITKSIPQGFGGGDIKLMAICGAWLGWKNAIVAIVVAIIAGGVYSIYLLLKRNESKNKYFSFGPFLVLGILVAYQFGYHIIEWYKLYFIGVG